MTYRTRNIFIAVGLAMIAAMLTMFYVTNYKKNVRADEATVSVYVAAKEVPAGTPGNELVKKKFIKTSDVTRRTVVAGSRPGDQRGSRPGAAGDAHGDP